MKFKSFNRVLAALLMLTMLAGQVLMSTAMALNEEPGIVILDESDLLEAEPTQEEPQQSGELPIEDSTSEPGIIEISEEEFATTPTPVPVEPTDTPEASPTIEPTDTPLLTATLLRGFNLMSNNADELANGGITINISGGKETVEDGETCTFSVTITDTDLNATPNLVEGTEVTVKLPEFLDIKDIETAYNRDWKQWFENAEYDQNEHKLILTLANIDSSQQTVSISFNIETVANFIGYEGDGKGKISIGIAGLDKYEEEKEIGTGTGTGTGETEPYLQKTMFANYLPGADKDNNIYILNDKSKPITYRVNFGVSKNYTENVVIEDDMSGGALALCDVNGSVDASLDKCIKLYIGGSLVALSRNGESLTGTHDELGNITISKSGTGFSATFSRGDDYMPGTDSSLANIELRYFAKLVGDVNDVTNKVNMKIGGDINKTAQVVARSYWSGAVTTSKYIMNGSNEVTVLDIDEKNKTVTFRIRVSAYGENAIAKDTVIVTDVLEDCFSYKDNSVIYGTDANQYFKLAVNDKVVTITKISEGAIKQGFYTIDFTVDVDMDKLQPGGVAQNKISDNNVVYVRRDAELTVDKTWKGDGKGKEATFQLIGQDKGVIDAATVKDDGSATLYISADKLNEGINICTLHEIVAESSAYVAGPDKEVVINKKDNVVTIVSVEGGNVNKGTASVSIENKLDSQKGSVTFRKYGDDKELLAGGTFQLYMVDGDESKPVGKAFSTVNGEYIIDNLPYGTYYVKEIAAPNGYILEADAESDKIEIKKVKPHATIEMTNEKYTSGAITIKKVDEKGNPLAGAEFMLLPGGIKKTTRENGEAVFDGLTEGTYTITETEAPTGYGKLEGYVTVNIEANGTANVAGTVPDNLEFNGKSVILTWKNTRTQGSISITKTGSEGKPLQGAVFGLYNDAAAAEKPIDIQQTDKNGKALFADLAAGTYYVKEITAPNGYALSDEVHTFIIGNGENAAWDCGKTITNQLKKYTLKLTKKGDDGNLLEGVEFTLSGSEINPMTAESGPNGVVSFEGLAFGTYTITESKTPEGYIPAKEISVEIKGNENPLTIQLGDVVNRHTKLTVTKFAEDGNTKLPGAEFVIKKTDGKYVKAAGNKFSSFVGAKENATIFTTGEDGNFALEYLPLGEYVLEEVKAPDGYLTISDPENFTIENESTAVRVGNTRIKADLKIIKTDENGKLLEGIKFTLKNSAGGFVTASGSDGGYTYTGLADTGTELVTDKRGEILISGLLWGTYYLSETDVPKGIVGIKDKMVTVDAGSHNRTIELKLENRSEKGNIEFKKTDGAGNGLSGAVFKLKLVEGSGTAYSIHKQMYAISDDKGRVSFEDVPYGVYELTEVIAPEGYVRSNDTYYVSIGGAVAEGKNIGSVPAIWANPRTEKEFTVKKVSAAGGEPLSGAVFQVLDEDENPIIGGEITTTNGGSGKIKLPLGRYYLKETVAPEGYELNEELIPFEVTTNGRNTVTVKNTPKAGSLTIQKIDKDGKPLLGAEFKIYAAGDAARETPIYTLLTDSKGKAVKTGIPYGSYVAIESRAPEGYERDNTVRHFDMPQKAEDGKVTDIEDIRISVENTKSRYALSIVKRDINDENKKLANTKFAVRGGGFYAEAETGEDGAVTVEVPAAGTYSITEIVPPVGYTLDPKTYTVEVTGHTAVGAEVKFTAENYKTKVELKKVDERGIQLEGAEFSIFDAEGKQPAKFTQEGSVYTYSESGSVTEIAAGYAEIVGLPVGDYILRENEAPANYVSLEDIRFRVRADMYDTALELTAENLPHEKGVAVLKESPEGTRLRGAVFTLYKDDSVIKEVTTDNAGVALFTGLNPGSYYIKETKAPEGYKPLDKRFDFIIDANGDLRGDGFSGDGLYTLTVKNSPLEYGFKVKKVSANDESLTLPGAEFRVLGGGLDRTYTTKADGLTEQITLPIGEYTLTEMKAPDGYVMAGTGRHISVRADGIYLDGDKLTGTAEITVQNAPGSFKLKLVKVDADINQPLANVAFILKGEDGGTHSLITGSDGTTDTISLAPGKYTLSEVAAADGYAIPLNGWGFTVTEGTVQQVTEIINEVAKWDFKGGLLTLTLKNSRIYGGLTIEKTDGKDGSGLAGGEFTIAGSDGIPLTFIKKGGRYEAATGEGASSTIATDANGTAHITGLKFGNYAVTETKAPEGYVLKGDRHSIAISRQQTEVTLRLKNDKAMYKVTAIKQDADENGKLLVGAEFTLYSAEGAVVAKAVTGYDGAAVFEVPEGDYKLVETRAPAGYQLSGDFVREITVNAVRGAVGEFKYTFNNEKTSYSIEIHKHDSEDKQKKLAGAEFAVTDSRGFTKTVTTDASGKASITELPYDDYTIREIKAPKGYALSDKEYSVKKTELVHGSPVVIEAANKYILGSVTIKKVDHENPEKLLEGAKFNVTDENGSLLMWKAEGDVYTLDDRGSNVITAGRITLKELPEGTYTLTEIDAPSGYAILDGSRTFTITEANMTAPLEIKVENLLRRTAVGFIKVDKNNKELRLAGAEFTLYRMNGEKQGEVVATGVTNNNGLVTFTELTMGSYRAKETKAPKGYKLWNAPIDFTVDEYGKVSVGSTELKPEGLVYTAMITNTAEEKEITLKKVSDTGEALTGATFRLSGEKSYILTTGSDGTAKISLPYGDYILEEVIAPDGYVLSSEKQALNLSDSGLKLNGKAVSGFTVTLKNQPVTFALTLHKRDASTGKALSGATFKITGNSYTKTATADASGNTETIKLRPGTYGITETATPSGYIRPLGGWTLTVERDGDMSVSGNGAYISLGNTVVLTVDNISNQPCTTPTQPPCSTPGPGSTPKPAGGAGKTGSIGKTGELGGDIRLLCGAAMMLLSFTGLLALLIADGRKKQKYMIGM
ncbi:MAG: SpaA isopeptide-forming pilin-related protein [Clostridiales bacterium]|nr:SpaA isopeptide-forming pilin-related protein [Clostridiales bacterium]